MRAPQRWALRLLAVGVLALVFISYLRPSMIVELGNRLWSCF